MKTTNAIYFADLPDQFSAAQVRLIALAAAGSSSAHAKLKNQGIAIEPVGKGDQ